MVGTKAHQTSSSELRIRTDLALLEYLLPQKPDMHYNFSSQKYMAPSPVSMYSLRIYLLASVPSILIMQYVFG